MGYVHEDGAGGDNVGPSDMLLLEPLLYEHLLTTYS